MQKVTCSVLAICAATCALQARLRPDAFLPGISHTRQPGAPGMPATTGSVDETDRLAFESWFTFLVDAQFERPTNDVTDCASLVRHAYREALRSHSNEWYRTSRLPRVIVAPDVKHVPAVAGDVWPVFRVSRDPERFAEFADAKTLVRMNARWLGRDAGVSRPGDLLYFRQEGAGSPDHLMVFVGQSSFDAARRDWVVYHTGPQGRTRGEMRKVSLADLQRHPAARWRPIRSNPAFAGVFRLNILDRER